MLSTTNLSRSNPHWAIQNLHIENQLPFQPTIDIREAVSKMKDIELKNSLAITPNIEALAHSHHHSTEHRSPYRYVGDEKYSQDIKQNRPPYHHFYNQELQDLIIQLYKSDFDAYGYSYIVPN